MNLIIGRLISMIVLYSLIATSEVYKLWPMGSGRQIVIVPYVISSQTFRSIVNSRLLMMTATTLNATQRATILEGLSGIENVTCVRFFIRKSQNDYVRFEPAPVVGSAKVGRVGGMQEITLSPFGSMNKERTMHEMLHTLGFDHMQQHSNRDNYVMIMWQNIKANDKSPYIKISYAETRAQAQGTPYDLDSLMHYPKNAFSKNGKNTIITKDPTMLDNIGHKLTLSQGDALRINRMYNCPGYVIW